MNWDKFWYWVWPINRDLDVVSIGQFFLYLWILIAYGIPPIAWVITHSAGPWWDYWLR